MTARVRRKRAEGCPRRITDVKRCKSSDLTETRQTKRTGLHLYKRYACRTCGHSFWRKVSG